MAAIAIAAIIIGAVVVGVNNAKVEVYSARVLCLIQSVVGAGQCDEAIGDGPGSGYGPDNVNEPWYCEIFGIGCSDQPTTDPDDVEIPDGLDRNDPIVQMMLSTERGRQVLQWLADNDIPIVVDPSATGAFWNGSEIVLGPGYDNAAVLVHEANHARYTVEGQALPRSPTRTVTSTCRERSTRRSTAPCSRSCRPRSSATAGAQLGSQPGETQYNAAYQQVIRNGGSQAEAQDAGYQAVSDLFYNGGIVTSTNGQSYPDYYGGYWDSEH